MKRVTGILLITMLTLLTACGQENSGDSGAIAVTLVWPEETSFKTGIPGTNVLRATLPPTIITITMTVTGDGMDAKSRDFDASNGEGTISGIPVGTRTVTFDGKNTAGTTLYRGVKTGVVVQKDVPAVFAIEMESLF